MDQERDRLLLLAKAKQKLEKEKAEQLPEEFRTSKLESGLRGGLQGLTLNTADEITGALGAIPALFTKETVPDRYRRIRDDAREKNRISQMSNPKTYGGANLVGATASTAIPVLGQVGKLGQGATLGAKIMAGLKSGATLGGIAGAGASEADLTKGELGQFGSDTGQGAVFGGTIGALIPVGTGALGRLGNYVAKTSPGKKIVSGAKEGVKKTKEMFEEWIIKEKPNADEIRAASEALGIKPTPGMIYDSKPLQNLEDIRNTSPSLLDVGMRKQKDLIENQLQNSVNDAFKDKINITPYELGDRVKDSVGKTVTQRFNPIKQSFEDLRNQTSKIDIPKASATRISNNLTKIPEIEKFGSSVAKDSARFVKDVNRVLEKNPTVDDLQQLMSIAKESLRDNNLSVVDKKAISGVLKRIQKLEDNTIKRAAVRNARNPREGENIGLDMLKQFADTRRRYREGMTDLGNVSKFSRIKQQGPGSSGFLRGVDDLQSERISEKLFPLSDVRARTETIKQFPEAAELMQKAKLGEMADNIGGNARKLVRETDKLDPEAILDLFGPNASKIKNLDTVTKSLPQTVNPSGTSKGDLMRNMPNMVTDFPGWIKRQGADAGNVVRYNVLANQGKIASGLKNLVEKTPETLGRYANVLQEAALRGGNALNATNYVLQQNDAEYRQRIKELFSDDSE